MKFKPLHDRILVRQQEKAKTSRAGIILVSDKKNEEDRAEVLAVGNGKVLKDGTVREMAVAPGDVIIFNKYSGNEIELDNEKYLVLVENEVLAIVD